MFYLKKLIQLAFTITLFSLNTLPGYSQDSITCFEKTDMFIHDLVLIGTHEFGVEVLRFRTVNGRQILVEVSDTVIYDLWDTVDIRTTRYCHLTKPNNAGGIHHYYFHRANIMNVRKIDLLKFFRITSEKITDRRRVYTIEAEGKIIPNPPSTRNKYGGKAHLFVYGKNETHSIPIDVYLSRHLDYENLSPAIIGFHDRVHIKGVQLVYNYYSHPYLRTTPESEIELLEKSAVYTDFQKKIMGKGFVFDILNKQMLLDHVLSEEMIVVKKYKIPPNNIIKAIYTEYGNDVYYIYSTYNNVSSAYINTDTSLSLKEGELIRVKIDSPKYKRYGLTLLIGRAVKLDKMGVIQDHITKLDTLSNPLMDISGKMIQCDRAVFAGYLKDRNHFNVDCNGRIYEVNIKNEDSDQPRRELGEVMSFTGMVWFPKTSSRDYKRFIDIDALDMEVIQRPFPYSKEVTSFVNSSVNFLGESDTRLVFKDFELIIYNYNLRFPNNKRTDTVNTDSALCSEGVFNSLSKRIIRIHTRSHTPYTRQ